ncbi:hypothetical protein VOLCADRAFT_107074 [Volvox carteri f. nagariensis]|uniref:UspA domain-containing protein n=1 Tax=Volvox carteri f. nagariensis TaxID=3068 RepID=D8UBU5_VOLCA|nr:uncharacterized protein VOLCADRAFT_107074 [Volvox carteri f. nagariensis]EFJ42884.1 hypothetical protein VOLCADRAFT_107074 [Volvox carteri f. nagariensis]|eukprot:XP_002956144.1 hypothetical protein VOLCADRAFT_107074 [Volvox carteri f. nagariensis]
MDAQTGNMEDEFNAMAPSTVEVVMGEVKKRLGSALSIACAVDGSQMSDRAMAVGLSLFNNRRGDKFTVIHISDATKTYLSKHLLPPHLKNYYIDMAHGARVTAEWLCREKEEGRSTCECLTRLADKRGVELLIMGSWGRKGEKLDVLGTVSDFSLRQSHCSICIVRSTGSSIGGMAGGSGGGAGVPAGIVSARPAKYLFATDGSHAAHLAFCFLVTYLYRPTDSIYVVMVTSSDGTEEAKTVDMYKDYMSKHKINGAGYVKCIDRMTMTVPEGIVEAVTQYGCDVLVVGISGYGRKKLGSVSTDISNRASCTTIIVKDSREIVRNRYTAAGSLSLATEMQVTPKTPQEDVI